MMLVVVTLSLVALRLSPGARAQEVADPGDASHTVCAVRELAYILHSI
eukprot:COSAG02_NODE_42651_length_382_cov_1.254417_1_plen_47_part_10